MRQRTLYSTAVLLGVVAPAIFLGLGATELETCRAADESELAPPFAVMAGGMPLDIARDKDGHVVHDNAFPWFGDFDGDGKPDLLVGQHTHPAGREKEKGKGGRLRIYKNTGEKGSPRFGEPIWFDDLVPTGRIPDS